MTKNILPVLLSSWEETYKKGQLTLWIFLAFKDGQKYVDEIKEFCDHVKTLIKDDRLIIINDGAENIKKHVNQKVDSVIASIPFLFFSKEKGMGIVQDAYDCLSNEAYYSQVLCKI
jgi:phospholipid N-methyltransferase